ncbi:MAG: hypothetical protein GYA24_24505 [Candidatus Lokiarchaeota archaeon]|nr:hypothetical protein [Candidatus Lokiarchaeota archaeon]
MNLGDAFARRKQIDAEIENWLARLKLAGRDTLQYRTLSIENKDKLVPIPGSKREFKRTYSIEECLGKLKALIEEERVLALRISLTNQQAKAKLLDLDGIEKTLTIPELLVLKNDIAPKLENIARSIPIKAKGVEVTSETAAVMNWRAITKVEKSSQELSDKGHKIEKQVVDYYQIDEVADYGHDERKVFDEVDKIHLWLQRVRNSINEANKTELVEIDK